MITAITKKMMANEFYKGGIVESCNFGPRIYCKERKEDIYQGSRTQIGRIQENPRGAIQRAQKKDEKAIAPAAEMRQALLFDRKTYNAG